MNELPEAVILSRQIAATLTGRAIVGANCGNSPHKWVWYGPSAEELPGLLTGRTIEGAAAIGRGLAIAVGDDRLLVLEDFGGKLLYRPAASPPPAKYHFGLEFDDGAGLTLAVQGWGGIRALSRAELAARIGERPVMPLGEEFTAEAVAELMASWQAPKDPIKAWFTNGRSILGIGNGYLQDILWRAGIHPRRKVGELVAPEAIWRAVSEVMQAAVAAGGRQSERDLFDRPGGFRPTLDRWAKGATCPRCGTEIASFSYLGGTCYVCPECQPAR